MAACSRVAGRRDKTFPPRLHTWQMKKSRSLGFVLVTGTLIAVSAAVLARQWHEATTLRNELELARTEADQLNRLRAEHARLQKQQIPAADLEALRADHAALPRLRSELEALRKGSSTNAR
jgi:hypothetical protein